MKRFSITIAVIAALVFSARLIDAQPINPGGGASGGAVTVADGADVTQGDKATAACGDDGSSACTVNQMLKRVAGRLSSSISVLNTISTTMSSVLTAVTGSIPACSSTPCSTIIGATNIGFQTPQLSQTPISFSTTGTILARSVGTIKVYGMFFSCAASVTLTLQNGSTNLTGSMTLQSFFLPISSEAWFQTTGTNDFKQTGAGSQCSGTLYYKDN